MKTKFNVGDILVVAREKSGLLRGTVSCGDIVIFREPSDEFRGYSRCYIEERDIQDGISLAIKTSALELLERGMIKEER